MNALVRSSLRLLDRLSPPQKVSAHCDIPCGIYDPGLAQIAAQTVVRMHQLIEGLERPGPDADAATFNAYANSMSRYIATKEEHAELCKQEVRIIWADYFKPEHLEDHPELHTKVWDILKLGSKVRQTVDAAAADDLLAAVQQFAEAFWATKGVATRRGPSNQAVGGESVLPA
ncbi:MAG: superoxide dismutase, Ni [Chloroflexi bacterium]|nr:superoxide dismutase, Ni [Chloroflexota bacterium]